MTGNSEIWGKIGLAESGIDLSTSLYRALRASAAVDNRFRLPALGGHIDGVLVYVENSSIGIRIVVARDGVVPVMISAAVVRGALLSVLADGRFVTAAPGTGRVVAIAMESGSADLAVISALLLCGGPDAAADMVALTDNSAGTANRTIQAMPDPADAPGTADVLRDDIVANLLPAIRNNVADLADFCNDVRDILRGFGATI